MKKTLLLLFVTYFSYSQQFGNQNKNWVFGWKAHMIFDGNIGGGFTQNSSTTTNPYFPNSGFIWGNTNLLIDGVPPTQSVSSLNGQFLFGTQTKKLLKINSTTNKITTFAELTHFNGTETNSIIVPRPKNQNDYYVFSISEFGLKYFSVTATNSSNAATNNSPITLKDHLGNLIQDNTFSSKLTSSKHVNGIDYWLIAQVRVNNIDFLYSYLVTCNGVLNDSPTHIFQLPYREGVNGDNFYLPRELKTSHTINNLSQMPNVIKLASVYITNIGATIFNGVINVDFNRTTGEFINLSANSLINLNSVSNGNEVETIEFSSNDQFLFASTYNKIFQIDINNGLFTEIAYTNPLPNSTQFYNPYELELFQQNPSGITSLQKGPNGVIYANAPFRKKMGKINNENSYGNSSYSEINQFLMPVEANTTNENVDTDLNAFTFKSLPQLVQQQAAYVTPTILTDNDVINFNVCGNTGVQTSTASVLEGDLVNNSSTIDLNGFALQQVGGVSPFPGMGGFVLNPNGTISILPNTPIGTYTLQYKLCENTVSCTVCGNTSTVTINVNNNSSAILFDVLKDSFCINSTGVSTSNVLDNDTVNNLPATGSNLIVVSQVSTTNSGVNVNGQGIVSITNGTPYGEYTIIYKVCNACDNTVCSAEQTVKVYFLPAVTAVADAITADESGLLVSSPNNVLTNDIIYCTASATNNSFVQITQLSTSPYFSINTSTGALNVNSNIPMGQYVISYRICELANLSNCSEATVTLTVGLSQNGRANSTVRVSKILSNNKIFIAGDFSTYGGVNRNRLAVIENDFTLNTTFGNNITSFGPSSSGLIHDVEIDGTNAYVVGQFTTFNNVTRRNFAVVNTTTGAIQTTVLPGTLGIPTGGTYMAIYGIAKHNIGTNTGFILVGEFTRTFHGQNRGIVRLKSDGTFDESFYNFQPGTKMMNGVVTAVGVLPDNQSIIIGGDFTTCGNSTVRNGIAKYSSNGVLDPSAFANITFTGPPSGSNGSSPNNKIEKIYCYDNKIYVVGNFTSVTVGGVVYAKSGIVRFDTNGVLDVNFAGTGTNGNVKTATFSGTGTNTKIYIGGFFTQYNGLALDASSRHFIRLNHDGVFDNQPTSNYKVLIPNPYSGVNTSVIQPDGKIVIGGTFSKCNNILANNVTRINPANGEQSKTSNDIKEIELHDAIDVTVYPNPFEKELNLQIKNYKDGDVAYQVYDLFGKLILEGNFKNDKYTLNLENVASGNYLIRVLINNEVILKKVIKK